MLASQNGHTATVQLLLEAGADKEAKGQVTKRERKDHAHAHTHSCG
jgi:ankyrin repeat protein